MTLGARTAEARYQPVQDEKDALEKRAQALQTELDAISQRLSSISKPQES